MLSSASLCRNKLEERDHKVLTAVGDRLVGALSKSLDVPLSTLTCSFLPMDSHLPFPRYHERNSQRLLLHARIQDCRGLSRALLLRQRVLTARCYKLAFDTRYGGRGDDHTTKTDVCFRYILFISLCAPLIIDFRKYLLAMQCNDQA